MPSPVSIYIDMPPWMIKYLKGIATENKIPIKFPKKHDLNRILLKLVSNDPRIIENNFTFDTGTRILLPYNSIKDVYFYNKISERKRLLFRKYIKEEMYYEFRTYIKQREFAGFDRKVATTEFFRFYQISEDDGLKPESFYRSFTRYKQKTVAKLLNNNTYSQYRNICPLQATI